MGVSICCGYHSSSKKYTSKKSARGVCKFTEGIKAESGVEVNIQNLEPPILNNSYVGNFLMSACRVEGTEYDMDMPTSHHRAIES